MLKQPLNSNSLSAASCSTFSKWHLLTYFWRRWEEQVQEWDSTQETAPPSSCGSYGPKPGCWLCLVVSKHLYPLSRLSALFFKNFLVTFCMCAYKGVCALQYTCGHERTTLGSHVSLHHVDPGAQIRSPGLVTQSLPAKPSCWPLT